MYRTATTVCTGMEEKKESPQLAKMAANSNGYEITASEIKSKRSGRFENNARE